MNFGFNRSIFGGGFNRSDYSGERRSSWGRNPSSWGNSGAVQASYGENTQTLPNLNTQSTMNSTYGASFASNAGGWGGNSGGWGSDNGNAGWGGYYGGSNLPYNRPLPRYDNFLMEAYKPGDQQVGTVMARSKRRDGEFTIGNIEGAEGAGGFFGNFAYPRSMYGLS